MFCKNCGAQIPDGFQFCPKCGLKADMPKPFHCEKCGIILGKDDKFCPKCGWSIEHSMAKRFVKKIIKYILLGILFLYLSGLAVFLIKLFFFGFGG